MGESMRIGRIGSRGRSGWRTAAALTAVVGTVALAGCSGESEGAAPVDPDFSGQTVSCNYPSDGSEPAKPVDPPASDDVPAQDTVTYTLAMNAGDVAITMDRAAAPCSINSFASLAQQGYYDDTQCHRLTDQGIFVLQCGDPTGTGSGGPGYSFDDEEAGEYPAGTVAMANAGPNTNGSQFFLVYEDSPLPPDYTVLGTMDEASLEVVTAIAAESHDASNGPGDGKPNNEARITGVTEG